MNASRGGEASGEKHPSDQEQTDYEAARPYFHARGNAGCKNCDQARTAGGVVPLGDDVRTSATFEILMATHGRRPVGYASNLPDTICDLRPPISFAHRAHLFCISTTFRSARRARPTRLGRVEGGFLLSTLRIAGPWSPGAFAIYLETGCPPDSVLATLSINRDGESGFDAGFRLDEEVDPSAVMGFERRRRG